MSSELQVLPIHRALNRPDLLMGCERRWFLVLAVMVAALTFLMMTIPTTVLGIALWLGGFTALRLMAKADPQMSQVYMRMIRYRPYYPARSTPFAPSASHSGRWLA